MTTKLLRKCDGCGIDLGEGFKRNGRYVQLGFSLETFPGYSDGKQVASTDHVDVCSGACARKVLDEKVREFESIVTEALEAEALESEARRVAASRETEE